MQRHDAVQAKVSWVYWLLWASSRVLTLSVPSNIFFPMVEKMPLCCASTIMAILVALLLGLAPSVAYPAAMAGTAKGLAVQSINTSVSQSSQSQLSASDALFRPLPSNTGTASVSRKRKADGKHPMLKKGLPVEYDDNKACPNHRIAATSEPEPMRNHSYVIPAVFMLTCTCTRTFPSCPFVSPFLSSS